VEALVVGAEVLAELGKFSEARRQLDVALRADPENIRASALLDSMREAEVGPLLGEAGGHFLSDRLAEAEELLFRVLAIDPYHDRATRMLRSIRERREMGASDWGGGEASIAEAQTEAQSIEPSVSWVVHEESDPDPASGSVPRPVPEPDTAETQPVEIGPVETGPVDLETGESAGAAAAIAEGGAGVASPRRAFRGGFREFDWPMAIGLAALALALVLVVWLRPKRTAEGGEDRPISTLLADQSTSLDEWGGEEVGGELADRSDEVDPLAGRDRVGDRTGETSASIDDGGRDASGFAPDGGASGRRTKDVGGAETAGSSTSSSYFEEVARLVAAARHALEGGDWERSIEMTERARRKAPQSSLVLEVSADIHRAARSAAVFAQREAETAGASTVSPDAFGDAVEHLAEGNRESATSPLLAARSYRDAADLFRRSSEKARLRGLRMALDEYAAAHRNLDLERLVALWPSHTGDSYEATANWFAGAKSVSMEIDGCRMSLSAAGGAADCRVSQDYVPLRGSRHSVSSRRRFELERQGSRWQLNGVYSAAP